MIRVYIRDAHLFKVAELDDYQSIQLTLKHGDVSSWQIKTSSRIKAVQDFIDETAGVVIERDGVVIMTGPVGLINPNYSDGKHNLQIAGPDDTYWLSARRAEPGVFPYTAMEFDSQTGPAETVIKHYVNANLGPGATATRRSMRGRALTLAPDHARGSTVSIQARFDMLNEVVKKAAVAGGDLGCWIRHEVDGYDPRQLVFDVYTPADKTKTVTFAPELGNISTFDYENNVPKANHELVGGSGQGTAQQFLAGEDFASVALWGLIEGPLVNASSSSAGDEMSTTLAQALANDSAQTSVTVKATNTEQCQFMRDWQLGDQVTLVLDDAKLTNVIQEIDLTYEADKPEEIYPVIGSAGTTRPKIPKLFSAQRNLTKRLSFIETRQ